MECCFHFCTSENLVNETRVVKPGKLEQLSLLCLQSDWLKTVLDENNGAKPMEMRLSRTVILNFSPSNTFPQKSLYSHVCLLSHSLCARYYFSTFSTNTATNKQNPVIFYHFFLQLRIFLESWYGTMSHIEHCHFRSSNLEFWVY